MTDPRPRPRYGEYAPLPPAPDAPPTGPSIAPPSADASLNAQYQRGAAAGLTGADSRNEPPARKQRLWDVFLTATLLLFGVVDIINTLGTVGNLGPVLREGLAAQGVDSFTSDAVAAEAGGVANIVRVIVLVLTIVFALIQIQRKRLAFWIPLVGAALATIALLVAILIAVMGDPGFIAYVDSMR